MLKSLLKLFVDAFRRKCNSTIIIIIIINIIIIIIIINFVMERHKSLFPIFSALVPTSISRLASTSGTSSK